MKFLKIGLMNLPISLTNFFRENLKNDLEPKDQKRSNITHGFEAFNGTN
jgi:hypothetical protein